MPRTLVEELARVTTVAQGVWVEARRAADFGAFRASLETIIALKRQEGACLADPGGDPYDALLDEYEPGARTTDLARLFEALRVELVPLVAAIAGSNRPSPPRSRATTRSPASGSSARPSPGRLASTSSGAGSTPPRTRSAAGSAPATAGSPPGSIQRLPDGFFSILHEVGHGLYEQGVDPAMPGRRWARPSRSASTSRSRGSGKTASAGAGPSGTTGSPSPGGSSASRSTPPSSTPFTPTVNRVEPSLIRVQADEATYNLHILIRFELEQALIAGDLAVGDLPAAWNAKYRAFLGINPPDDAHGCLQDIHWAAGLIGYFPTYTLGNLYAAQLRDRAEVDLGGLDPAIARGDFAPLLDWLRSKIHRQGQRYPAAILIERATGATLDHRPLIRSLRDKYGRSTGSEPADRGPGATPASSGSIPATWPQAWPSPQRGVQAGGLGRIVFSVLDASVDQATFEAFDQAFR